MSIFNAMWHKERTTEAAESHGMGYNVANTATSQVLDGEAADTIVDLPEGAQAKKFGTFEAFTEAILGDNPTYDLLSNNHI